MHGFQKFSGVTPPNPHLMLRLRNEPPAIQNPGGAPVIYMLGMLADDQTSGWEGGSTGRWVSLWVDRFDDHLHAYLRKVKFWILPLSRHTILILSCFRK